MIYRILFAIIFVMCFSINSHGQDCPPNIGFESGNFDKWTCYSGPFLNGSANLNITGAQTGMHTLISAAASSIDNYGKFLLYKINGSKNIARVGNTTPSAQAAAIHYTINIPANQNDYSLIYHYAVVLQDPRSRQPKDNPRFVARIFNVTDNVYLTCGSFDFSPGKDLTGFQASTEKDVYVKAWSAVSVDLTGLAGKTIRLEFYTNDCADGQHLGYAYVDVNENCLSSQISGNVYCTSSSPLKLTAPEGFSYSWHNADFSKYLGNNMTLTINPPPPVNTVYALVLSPFDPAGCKDTLYSTIRASTQPFQLNVMNEVRGCSPGFDLTSPQVTNGSTPGLAFDYYYDINQTLSIVNPQKIISSGVYFVKGTNSEGCWEIKPVKVTIEGPSMLTITDPAPVCNPKKVDITDPLITAGSETGIVLSYWSDPAATIPLLNPNAVDKSGFYYIKGFIQGGCGIIRSVEVKIGEPPAFQINNLTGCGKINITEAISNSGPPGITYSYWVDPAATIPVTDTKNVTLSGTYYIKATAPSGCSIVRPVIVMVNPIPGFIVKDPLPVKYPVTTVDITPSVNQNAGLIYSYWLDSLARNSLADPKAVDKRGTYFIMGTNGYGCSTIKAVNVVIIPPEKPIVHAPNAFTPNGDKLNDIFKIKITGEVISTLRIYNRWGQVIYEDQNVNHAWDGKSKGKELPVGIYVWVLSGMDTYHKKPFSQRGLITLIR